MEIRRDFYLEKLIKKKHNGLIKVITGIRRCGKSYLLNNHFDIRSISAKRFAHNEVMAVRYKPHFIMSIFIDNSSYVVYNNKHNDDVEVVYRMGRKSVAVLPQTQAILEQLGEQIKLARLRRHLSAELVAQRAGVSRATVWNVEKGNPSVAIGIYAAVLHALNNMDKDLLLVAKDDELGRKLQDLELTTRKRAPRNGGD